ncbi:copper amine oxidase N-terminal domain-containing protein [Paenibacillus sp. KQZ6P-2]|uniref:Copper amine oxidase N-terminal domain-containing protein n=1 Tax=Paenibacillus mangrovi TaxID=2931978 RepID=A0A9X1WTJ3_9BACL|nr:copper amine oxidase N-terminal domain-containing protein [Paenibacillus mangrovi]MCJ8014814.1 copper amine oxidase N-terminal domain-containing protein [Paenibacillus mangrovi]
MKKLKITFTLFLLIYLLVPTLTYAALPLRVVVDGERVLFPDAQPFVDASNRVQVPIRFVSEALGAEVGWDNETRTATLKQGKKTMTLVVGKKEYDLDGKKQSMDSTAMLKDTRTFVPLRFVSEGLGATLKYDKTINTVYISTPEYTGSTGDDKVIIKDMYGFKVALFTGSELNIDRGDYDEYGTKNRALLILGLAKDRVNGNYEMQIQEVEDILRQKIKSDTVDDIMKYIRKEKNLEEQEVKWFNDETYRVRVIALPSGDTGVGIWYQ